MAKITRKTGKTDRIGGVVGAIVLGVMMLIGFAIPLPGNDPMGGGFFEPMDGFMIVFKIAWIVICGAGCGYNIYMAVKGEGISKETVEVGGEDDPLIHLQLSSTTEDKTNLPNVGERLRVLESLKQENLITDAEYEQKRAEIMSEKW